MAVAPDSWWSCQLHRCADKSVNIHATCVKLGNAGAWLNASPDAGVLLLGPSGVGKSDLAVRLIGDGALLVSDDRTELFVKDGALMAQAPPVLRGLLEIRGVGIIELPCAEPSNVTIAVMLAQAAKPDRLPEIERFQPPAGLEVSAEKWPPLLHLDPREASAAAKIAATVAGFEHGLFLESCRPRQASMSGPDR
ncbi:MAG: HPr kinase/phosphatase C-terminal domain-containing protein [Alphaproteobacteria bacterium]|nr:HPr kinase/phosphatase C-terminal domain-containing protein [Alphaproteobacteria bacterium]